MITCRPLNRPRRLCCHTKERYGSWKVPRRPRERPSYSIPKECWSIKQIALEIGHFENVVAAFLRNPKQYGKYKNSGRKPKLSPSSKLVLIRQAKKGTRPHSNTIKGFNLESQYQPWRSFSANLTIWNGWKKLRHLCSPKCTVKNGWNGLSRMRCFRMRHGGALYFQTRRSLIWTVLMKCTITGTN